MSKSRRVVGEFYDVTWDKIQVGAMTMHMTLIILDTLVASGPHADTQSGLAATLRRGAGGVSA